MLGIKDDSPGEAALGIRPTQGGRHPPARSGVPGKPKHGTEDGKVAALPRIRETGIGKGVVSAAAKKTAVGRKAPTWCQLRSGAGIGLCCTERCKSH